MFLSQSSSSASATPASPFLGRDVGTKPKMGALCFEGSKERIKKMFEKVELSVSAYDTAWVAMVASPNSPDVPFFPECLNWLLENQRRDGSWGLAPSHPLLIKDTLMSTLASVLALKQWGVAQEHINKGLDFLDSNLASSTDLKQLSPVGFNIIFPSMIASAQNLGLSFPLGQTTLNALLHKRELELTSCGSNSEGRRAYLAYVSEGLGNLQDWEMVMKYQRKNGSLFNSPSTTAVAFAHLNNDGCLSYLCSLLKEFSNAVPTVYPIHIYARLYLVDTLQRLGIDRHFRREIRRVLDETYRCWMQEGEDVFLEPTTCAMAFRILRLNGYDVSSDGLTRFLEENSFSTCLGGYLKDMGAVQELFKASQLSLDPDESILDNLNSWSYNFLSSGLLGDSIHSDRIDKRIEQEISDALKFPYKSTLERLSNRRAIECYSITDTRILKTSYSCRNFGHEDIVNLAVEDFNICQSHHRKELKQLARWVADCRLDQLNFARQKQTYCYFSAGATFFSPELCDARLSWAKNGVLTTAIDDFFDVGGSEEELENLIELVERWNVNGSMNYCSEAVEILFLALYSTVSEIGNKASALQGRSVTSHIVGVWLELLKSMLKEAKWARNKEVPGLDEYIRNGYVSFALGPIVLPALYFVGPKLSVEVVGNTEYHHLFMLMSTCGRLLNDIQSFERESKEGKLNAITLHMNKGGGLIISEEEATEQVKRHIQHARRELMRMVLQEKGSTVPRDCKDMFWKMSRILELFYTRDDGFTSMGMMNMANALFEDPLVLNQLMSRE